MTKTRSRLFVLGVGRSGTSLLQSMLNAHSQIAFLPETGFLRRFVFRKSKFTIDSCQELNEDVRLGVLSHLISKKDFEYIKGYKEYYDRLTNAYLLTNSKTIIGDKDPRFLEFVPELIDRFPSCKLIHIVRDPRDVILSRMKADWSKHWPFFMHVFIYATQMERGLEKLSSSHLVYHVKYEDLLLNATSELEKICDFMGVDFELPMLDFGDSARQLVRPEELQWKNETLGPLLMNNSKKWVGKLSNWRIALINEVCIPKVSFFGYEKALVNLNFFDVFKLRFFLLLFFFFRALYPLRIKFLK